MESINAVLAHYAPGVVASQDTRAGFSGAAVYRCHSGAVPLCLKACPAATAASRLDWIHPLMLAARQAGLAFVPRVHLTRSGQSWVAHEQRLWDLTDWMPGEASFHSRPSSERLHAVCVALGGIHASWERRGRQHGPCPAIERRVHTSQRWQRLLRSGWRAEGAGPLSVVTARAWDLLSVWMRRLPALLDPWRDTDLPLQPCLCDVWHDHLLFEDDRLTGLIDYGEAKIDHVAVDLARLLGSLVGDDAARWSEGLAAYRSVRPLTQEEEALARVLDRSGVILGASNWLRWLYHDDRKFADLAAVARRLGELVERMERWNGALIS